MVKVGVLLRLFEIKYCSMSGQLVNFHRSTFQCTANVSQEDDLRFKKILLIDNAFYLGTYLG